MAKLTYDEITELEAMLERAKAELSESDSQPQVRFRRVATYDINWGRVKILLGLLGAKNKDITPEEARQRFGASVVIETQYQQIDMNGNKGPWITMPDGDDIPAYRSADVPVDQLPDFMREATVIEEGEL